MWTWHGWATVVLALALSSCSLARGTIGSRPSDAGTDGFSAPDLGVDAALPDDDSGVDAGRDAGFDTGIDSGSDGGRDAGPPDAGPGRLDLFTGGTFTRASEASYRTGAPTDGTSAFLAWAPPDTRRIEDRGDGTGPMLLLEGSRTNVIRNARDLTATTAWPSTGNATISTDGGSSPDGTTSADRVMAPGGYSPGASLSGLLGSPHSISAYGRATSGSTEWRTDYHGAMVWSGPVGTTWTRREAQQTSAGETWFAVNGFGSPYDVLVDLFQAETGPFPTSPIRTTGAAVTRAGDVLTYAPGQYPAEFLTRGFTVTYVPDCSSDELLASGEPHTLLATDLSNQFALAGVGGAVRPLLVTHGLYQIGLTAQITFSRYQPMTFTVEPANGTITITGATTGNGVVSGASSDLVGGVITIGGAGTHAAFGRFQQYLITP